MRRLPLALLALLALASSSRAASINWTGGASDGNWYTTGNWTPAQVPQSGDDATIDANVTVTVSASSPPITFNTLTLGDAAGTNSPTLTVSTTIVTAGSLQVDKNAVLKQDTTNQFTLGAVVVSAGGTITQTANAATLRSAVNLRVTGSMTVQASGAVDVTGTGYAGGAAGSAGSGSGSGGGAASGGGGGAGHGGTGGAGQPGGHEQVPRRTLAGRPPCLDLRPQDISSSCLWKARKSRSALLHSR